MPILLLVIDDRREVTPIGVYPNWREAFAAAHDNDFDEDHTSAPLDIEHEPVFQANFEEAFEPYERAPSDEGMDLTFESPSGNWSYRLVQVPVHLGVHDIVTARMQEEQ